MKIDEDFSIAQVDDEPAALRLVDDQAEPEVAVETERDMHALCEQWAMWISTRRMYVKPSMPVSLLGRLRTKGPGGTPGGPDAIASAELMAFHLAYLAQPIEAIDRRVFEAHYYWRVRNVKAAADVLGISRRHWYRLIVDFRSRVFRASRHILEVNMAAADDLPSRAWTEK